jgi:glycosyltransferase involved in cell wall biosynthesis
MNPTLTVAILTLNEERRISKCIESAKWADHIVVADSGSTDQTVAIAQSLGAQVHLYPDWQGFAEQRNRLLAHCHSDYVLFLDADEELTDALSAEIKQALAEQLHTVWTVEWEQISFGRSLGAMTKQGIIPRLFLRKDLLSFEGVVHEHPVLANPNTRFAHLKNRMPHHSRETVYASLLKLAQYAHLGSAKRAMQGKRGGIWRGFASGLASFVRLYFFRRGFLCGGAGFLHCLFISLECFFRYAAIQYDQQTFRVDVKR